ncbi:MAG: hypothetical protein D6808_03760 [Candidatus Dadabacteria bacterium]|nr:MAG: hypothetical protein D6808_03760 [Candidatus Dadabacteria bacterium]
MPYNRELINLCKRYDRIDLTSDPDFISTPPNIPLLANIKVCEEMLAVWNKDRFTDGRLPEWKEEFYL